MAKRDPPHEGGTGFVTLFARAPQLCAGALAGLGSILWLNVVAPFAGHVAAWGTLVLANGLAVVVVAVLAVLVTTAGTLLAADWREDASSRQAWAEVDVAAAELCLRLESVAQPHIDPRYLAGTDIEARQSVFRAHCFTPRAPAPDTSTHTPAATRIVAASGGSTQTPEASKAEPRLDRQTTTTAGSSDVVAVARTHRAAANASIDEQPIVVTTWRARPRFFRPQCGVSAPRLVANGGASPEWLPHDRYILTHPPSDGSIADIITLSGDRGDRDRPERVPDPCTGGSIVGSVEPPNCRGPPSVAGRQPGERQAPPAKLSVEGASPVHTASALPTGDPLVVDDLGRPVPICTAELDVIETYLGRALQDLLGPGASVPDREKS